MIRNINEVKNALSALPGVRLSVQDFTEIDFAAQLALVQSAGILISMHGAALAHMFYMSIGDIARPIYHILQTNSFTGFMNRHGQVLWSRRVVSRTQIWIL